MSSVINWRKSTNKDISDLVKEGLRELKGNKVTLGMSMEIMEKRKM